VNVLDTRRTDRDLLNLAGDVRTGGSVLADELPATYTPLFSALKLGATAR
jgi:hypothetical protein